MDSDKVLVLDAGNVVEFDHPHILLGNKNGYLYKMAEKTGKDSVDMFRGLAEKVSISHLCKEIYNQPQVSKRGK